jgi:hypothetical protein
MTRTTPKKETATKKTTILFRADPSVVELLDDIRRNLLVEGKPASRSMAIREAIRAFGIKGGR